MQCPQEHYLRCRISNATHNLVLVLSSANCLHHCAQWYVSKLKHMFRKSLATPTGILQVPGGTKLTSFPAHLQWICGEVESNTTFGTYVCVVACVGIVEPLYKGQAGDESLSQRTSWGWEPLYKGQVGDGSLSTRDNLGMGPLEASL